VTKVTKSLKETLTKHIDLPAKAIRRSGTTSTTIQTAPSLMDVPGKEELIGFFLQKARFIKLILFNTLFSLRAGTQQSPTTNARMKSRPAVRDSPAVPTEPRLLSTSSKDDAATSGIFFLSFFISFFELNIFLHVHSSMGFQGPNAQLNHVYCLRRQKMMPQRLVVFFLSFFVLHF